MMVPSPGKANWLTMTASHAEVRLGGFGLAGSKEVVIEEHESQHRPRPSHEDPNPAGQSAAEIDQTTDEDKAEDGPPTLRDDFAAHFHCFPEAKALVDDQRQGEMPGDHEVDARQDTTGDSNTNQQRRDQH